ncbi:WD repeat-containing protein 38-like [Heterodontus francisci]|uniref:WD repeat-containing protein 38-like n=1 Tax=Heterodontus francisci TaxID=7792 RepID=UPI00355BEA94
MACFVQVNQCTFSRDGRLLLTGSDDCNVCVWNVGNGNLLSKVEGHTEPHFIDVALTLFSNMVQRAVLLFLGHTKSVESVCFSRDSKLLASGSWDHKAIMWDSKSGLIVKTLSGHQNVIKTCAFSFNGEHLATGSWDYTVRIWKIRKVKRKLILRGHTGNVSCVAFSGFGMLASGSWDKTVRVWDSRNGLLIFLLTEHTGRVMALSFSLDAILLVTAAEDKTVECEGIHLN